MKLKQSTALAVLAFIGVMSCLACFGYGEKEEIFVVHEKSYVQQPFSGEMVDLLYRAIELHKKEVGVPLKKYKVEIRQDDKYYYIYFCDREQPPNVLGSRPECPNYNVRASKEKYEILRHYKVK